MRPGALLLGVAVMLAPASHGSGRSLPVARAVAPETLPPPSGAPKAAALARAINAAAPLATGFLAPARPFHLDAGAEDRARAIDCLAAADYYEAGREPADQRAVAQVVLNRVRHAAFPATICGVVFAGAERATGCQFTFTCDGSLTRRRPSAADWRRARETAGEMLLGRVEIGVGKATHYHTDWVSPSWDRTMEKLAVVKSHLFFGWPGAAGKAAAFIRHYAGGEPRIAQLAQLSAAHLGQLPAGTAPAVSDVIAPEPSMPETAWAAPDPGLFLVTLPANAPGTFPELAERRCEGLEECRFIGWTDPARRAQALPLPGGSVDAISFTFVRRPGAADQALWNCAEFARTVRAQCLTRGT
jgi:spore germination cell wall hydrolase CwlJ-like protein